MKSLVDRLHTIIPPFLLIGVLLLVDTQGIHAEESWTGKVVQVKDGDTLVVQRDEQAVVIRLYGIDCPEKTQAFGVQATRFTVRMVLGKTVNVHPQSKDRYGRIVGTITLTNGRSLNSRLVKAGLAWWYRRYAPKDENLKTLETKARNQAHGLWAGPSPIPPWDYRKIKQKRKP